MIRRATHDDLDEIVEIAGKLISDMDLPAATDDELRDIASRILDDGVIFLAPGGMIWGLVVPLYYKPDHLEANEIFWWSDGGHGLSLVRAFEAWGVEQGAKSIVMSSKANIDPAVPRWLERRGYAPREQTYVKRAF